MRSVDKPVNIGPVSGVLAPVNGQPSSLLRGKRILLVEDEPSLLAVLTAMLEAFGCAVRRCSSTQQALQAARGGLDDVDMVLTDILLGRGDNGLELARQLCAIRPGLPVLYMSGYVGPHTCEALGLEPGRNFLPKPFRVEELREALLRSLGVTLDTPA